MNRCFPSVELKAVRFAGRARPLNEYFGLGSGGGSGVPGSTRGSDKLHELLFVWFMHSASLRDEEVSSVLAALEYDKVLK